jgi:hypothetical protein
MDEMRQVNREVIKGGAAGSTTARVPSRRNVYMYPQTIHSKSQGWVPVPPRSPLLSSLFLGNPERSGVIGNIYIPKDRRMV